MKKNIKAMFLLFMFSITCFFFGMFLAGIAFLVAGVVVAK